MEINPWPQVNDQWRSIGLWTIVFILLTGLLSYSCSTRDPKFQQYFVQGQILYEKHCSNCHQKNGQGLGRVYPPLAASDFLKKNFEQSFCSMKYGMSGEIIVNGKNFNKPMPGVRSLTELEIAEIATYISNAWGEQKGIVDIQRVKKVTSQCEIRE